MSYKYFQPNKLDIKDKRGDCAIRALAKTFDCTWGEAFTMCIEPVLKHQVLFNDSNAKELNKIFEEIGLFYTGTTPKKGKKRQTVAEFAKSTKGDGKHYIAKVPHHFVAVYDGVYYDTWDSGKQLLYGYYTKEDKAGA